MRAYSNITLVGIIEDVKSLQMIREYLPKLHELSRQPSKPLPLLNLTGETFKMARQ